MQFDTRYAEINDVDAIAHLSEQWGYKSTHEKILSCLQNISSNKDHVVFVVLCEGKITGWIHGIYSLRVESDPFIEIGGLVVDEQYRRLGLGKALIDKIIEWSEIRNCDKIRVRCNIIREANAFYVKSGFIEIKQQKVYDLATSVKSAAFNPAYSR